MQTERSQHKEAQSRTIEQPKQAKPKAAYMEDNRDTAQMRTIDMIQRVGMEEEELQMKPIVQLHSEEEETLQGKFEPIQQKANNTGLPDNLKSGVESMSGFSMDDVRVHYNSDKPAQMQAHAYAQGTNIHVAPGQERHLPHEAWHVVQQKQGRVQPTMQLQGTNVNDNVGLEYEADIMGRKMVEEKHNNKPLEKLKNISLMKMPIQKEPNPNDLIEGVVFEEDMEAVKMDVDAAMTKIIAKIRTLPTLVEKLTNSRGRNAIVYVNPERIVANLMSIIDSWSKDWSIEGTCGLLMDIGYNLRTLQPPLQLLNQTMIASRLQNHGVDMESDWVKECIPEGTEVQSGVSASTANLISLIHHLDATTLEELEAILIGAVQDWRDIYQPRREAGLFHTAAEVWAPYMMYLEGIFSQQEE